MTREIGIYDKSTQKVRWFTPRRASESVSPAVWTDTIPPTMSHATDEGLIFTSRSALFEHYKQYGYECTGGDHLTGRGLADVKYVPDKEQIRHDVQEAYRKLQWNEVPLTEKEKETCRREERVFQEWKKRNRKR